MTPCSTCGEPLKEFSKFCLRCGTPISEKVSHGLITQSLNNPETRKVFNYLNSRINLIERRVEDSLQSLRRIEKLLVEQGILEHKEITDMGEYQREALGRDETVVSQPTYVPKALDVKMDPVEVAEPTPPAPESIVPPAGTEVTAEDQEVVPEFEVEEPLFPDPTMPMPDLFSFDVEYDVPLVPVPVPRGDTPSTRIEKKSLFRQTAEFIETKGMISVAVIGFLVLILLTSLATVGNDISLQSLSLVIVGSVTIALSAVFYSGVLRTKSHVLGSLLLFSGYSVVVISSLGAVVTFADAMSKEYIQFYLYFVYLSSLYLVRHYGSNINAAALSLSTPLIPVFLSHNAGLEIFVGLGGLIWIAPLALLVFEFGLKEFSSYPAIMIFLSTSAFAPLFSDLLIGGYSVSLVVSIIPLAILLDRGKVELLRNHLITLYSTFFSVPILAYLLLMYQKRVVPIDSFVMYAGLAVTYTVSTTEFSRGSFKRSIMLQAVIKKMRSWANIYIPLVGVLFSWVFHINLRSLPGGDPFMTAFLPGFGFIVASISYALYTTHKRVSQSSDFSVLLSLASAEYSFIIVSASLLQISDVLVFNSARAFLLVVVFLPLVIGVLGSQFPEKLRYSGGLMTAGNSIAILNSFVLANFLFSGLDSILASIAGITVFLIAVITPNLDDRTRRGNYEIALVGNSVSLMTSQILHKFDMVLHPVLSKYGTTLGIDNFGPFFIYALFVSFAGIAFYRLSQLSTYRISVHEGMNFVQKSISWVMSRVEHSLLRYQELSFSLFINLTFSVFALTGGFPRTSGDALFTVSTMLLLLPVNLLTMYLARGRHWGTIIPSIFPFLVVASISRSLSNSILVVSYVSIIAIALFISDRDVRKERTDLATRTLGRDITVWSGLLSMLMLGAEINPISFALVIGFMTLSSLYVAVRVNHLRTSGLALILASMTLSLFNFNFSYEFSTDLSVVTAGAIVTVLSGVISTAIVSHRIGSALDSRQWDYTKDALSLVASLLLIYSTRGMYSTYTVYVLLATFAVLNSVFSLSLRRVTQVSYRSIVPLLLMGAQPHLLPVGVDVIAEFLVLAAVTVPVMIMSLLSLREADISVRPFMFTAVLVTGATTPVLQYVFATIPFLIAIFSIFIAMKIRRGEEAAIPLVISFVWNMIYFYVMLFNFEDKLISADNAPFFFIPALFIAFYLIWIALETLSSKDDRTAEKYFGVVTYFVVRLSMTLLAEVFSVNHWQGEAIQFAIFALIASVLGFYGYRRSTKYSAVTGGALLLSIIEQFVFSQLGDYLVSSLFFLIYVAQVLVIMRGIEKKEDFQDENIRYNMNIVIAAVSLTLLRVENPMVFVTMTLAYGGLLLVYEGMTKKEVGVMSLLFLVSSVLNAFLIGDVPVVSFLGYEFNLLFAVSQVLMAGGIIVYARRDLQTYNLAFFASLALSFYSNIAHSYLSGNAIVDLIPMVAASVVLWRNSDPLKQGAAVAYSIIITEFIYMVDVEMTIFGVGVYLFNIVNLVIMVFSSQENTLTSQKTLLGINLFVFGSTLTDAGVWSLLSLGGLEAYVWVALLYIYVVMVNIDVRSGGFKIVEHGQVNSEDSLAPLSKIQLDRIEDGIGLTQLMFTAVMLFWIGSPATIFALPLMAIYGVVAVLFSVSHSDQVNPSSIKFLLVGNLLLLASSVWFVQGTPLPTWMEPVLFQWVVATLVALPMGMTTLVFTYRSLSRMEHFSSGELTALLSGVALMVFYIVSVVRTLFIPVYPIVFSVVLLASVNKERQIVTLGSILFYITSFLMGAGLTFDLRPILKATLAAPSLAILLSGGLVYAVSMYLELGRKVDRTYSPMMLITILALLYSTARLSDFVTGIEQSLTFVGIAMIASLTYVYGVKLNKRYIRYLGSAVTGIGFIGGIAFLFKVWSEGILEIGPAIVAVLAGITASLSISGINSVIKDKERDDIFRIFVPVEDE